ncbi:MAG: hypothetical protein AAGA93_27980 [Actinomycetota bacterium]
MGVFHRATITPTKADAITAWIPTRPWGPAADATIEVIGAYRFDDPENRVGMETHLVTADGVLFQVPLTYREGPVDGAEAALVTEMEHSELGTRWVYDGLLDERYVLMLAAVTMTGQGEALGMVLHEDRWHIAPANVRIEGGGWGLDRVPVDGFGLVSDDEDSATLRNDRFELTFFRRPEVAARPPIGLTGSLAGQAEPVVLAEVTET